MSATSRTRKPGRLGGCTALAPDLFPHVPDNVRETSERFAEAFDHYRASAAAVRDATTALHTAEAEDRQAAHAASLEGTDKLPKAKAIEAQEALTHARRVAEAAEAAAQTRQGAYVAAVLEAGDEIGASAHDALASIAESASADVDNLEARLIERVAVRRLLDQLGDGSGLMGRNVTFRPSRTGKELRADGLSGPVREHLDALRRTFGDEKKTEARS